MHEPKIKQQNHSKGSKGNFPAFFYTLQLIFTLEYLILSLLWVIYFTIHTLLASDKAKEKINLGDNYRLGYNLLAITLLIPIVIYQNSITDFQVFNTSTLTVVIGYLGTAIGLFLFFIALKGYDGKEFIGIEQPTTLQPLKTDGLNQYVRHPLYSSALLFLWFLWLTQGGFIHLLVSVLISAYLVIGSKSEEKKLVNVYGEEYITYKNTVKMLIPFIL